MIDWLTGLVLALVAAGTVVTVVLMARDEPAGDRTFVLLALAELAILAQAVVGLVLLARTEREVEGVVFASYLVGAAVALPVGAFWSLAERSRAGTAVLLVALLTVAALVVRLESLWSGGA